MKKRKKLNLKKVTILNFSIKNSLKGGVQTIEVACYTEISCQLHCKTLHINLASCNPQSTGPTEPQSIDSMDGIISGIPNCAL